MRIKAGVNLDGVHYLLWYAAAVYDALRQSYGYGEGTVTGGREGADVLGGARVGGEHGVGIAVDLRTRDLPPMIVEQIRRSMKALLGDGFDVIIETDHLHVDLFPGTMRQT